MSEKTLLVFAAFVVLLAGCIQTPSEPVERGPTINDFFGEEIESYTETALSETIECLSGDCPSSEPSLGSTEKECYFCGSARIEGGELSLHSVRGQSLAQDASFGCIRRYEGPVMNGFQVVEETPSSLRVRGEVDFYYSQKGTHCDREKDPECVDATYGSCDGGDYSQVFTRTIEMVFAPAAG